MCTISVVPHDQGFRAMFNRDERDSRADAEPPARHRLASQVAIYPTDPQGGGTWIGSNQLGLVMALLNRNREGAAAAPRSRWSRGVIVRSLLDCGRLADVVDAAGLIDVSFFEPFELLALHRREGAVFTSDGRQIRTRQFTVSRPLLLTSSSLGDGLVEEPRRTLFEQLVLNAPDGWLQGQTRFHAHQWPSRREISVVMQRPGARTVSRTVVDVRGERIDFQYESVPAVVATAA